MEFEKSNFKKNEMEKQGIGKKTLWIAFIYIILKLEVSEI